MSEPPDDTAALLGTMLLRSAVLTAPDTSPFGPVNGRVCHRRVYPVRLNGALSPCRRADWVQASPSCLVIVLYLQHLEQTAEGQLEQACGDVGNWHEVTVIAGLWRFSEAGWGCARREEHTAFCARWRTR